MNAKGPIVTLASLSYTDGRECTFSVGRGRLRGPKGKRYFDWNARDTETLARVSVSLFPCACGAFNHKPFCGVPEQLEAQYATPDAPPVDWSL